MQFETELYEADGGDRQNLPRAVTQSKCLEGRFSAMAASIIKLGNGSYAANRGLIILWVAVQVRDGPPIKQLLAEMQVDFLSWYAICRTKF